MHAKCMYCSAAVLPGVLVPMLLLGSAQGCKVLHSALHDANLAETPGRVIVNQFNFFITYSMSYMIQVANQ